MPAPGLTNSGKFRRQAAFAATLFALLVGGGLLWGTLKAQPEPLTRGSLTTRVEQLADLVARFEADLPPINLEQAADDFAVDSGGNRRLKARINLFRGGRAQLIRQLMTEADALAPAALVDDDLERVRLVFGHIASRLASHARYARALDPEYPRVGTGWRVTPGEWVQRLLEVANRPAGTKRRRFAALAAPLRGALPPVRFERIRHEAGIALLESVLKFDLFQNIDAYARELAGSGPASKPRARDLQDLVLGAVIWRDEHPGAGRTRLEGGDLVRCLKLIAQAPARGPEPARRIQAYLELRRALLKADFPPIASALELAHCGRVILKLAAVESPPILLEFPRDEATVNLDWSGPYLEAVLAGSRGRVGNQLGLLHVAMRALRKALDVPVKDQQVRAQGVNQSMQALVMMLETLAEAHSRKGEAGRPYAPEHAACKELFRFAEDHYDQQTIAPEQVEALKKTLAFHMSRVTCGAPSRLTR